MLPIIAISSQKGGVGKTTTCINLGAALASCGRRVLLIDLDPQGHMAEGFGIAALSIKHEMSDVLSGAMGIKTIIQEMRPDLFLAPSNVHLAHMEALLITQMRREDRLKNALVDVEDSYDYILIDCPPSLGVLTVNALSAANKVLIPMLTEFYALVGVSLILDTIKRMQRELNPRLEILGIVPTRLDNTRHSKDVVEMVRNELPDVRLFTSIPEAVAVRNATAAAQTIEEYDPSSPAAAAYRMLAQELES